MGESEDVKEAAAVLEAALPEVPAVAVIADEATPPAVEVAAPVVEAPVVEAPVVEAPAVEAPAVEAPAVVEVIETVAEPVIEAAAAVELVVIETAGEVEEAAQPVIEAVEQAVQPVIVAVEEAVQPVLEAVEPVVEAIVESIPEAVAEAVVELSAPLVEAVVTPDASTEVTSAPEPLPLLDAFAPCETLGDVAPAPVEVVVVVAEPAPVPEAPAPVAIEPIPGFGDLGALAGSVLNAPFNLGALSLDFSLATKSSSAYGASLSMATRGKALTSALESSHTIYGHDFKMRYTSERVLEEALTMKDVLLPGLNLAFNSEFTPDSGKVNLGLTSTFSNDLATVGVSATDNLSSVEASAVIHKSGWLAGILSNVDPKSPGNLAASFALGYRGPDFQAMTTLTPNKSLNAQIYQKLASGAECGIEVSAVPGAKPSLALAHKVALSDAATLAVKIDNSSLFSVGLSTALRPGVKLNICGAVNATNVAAGPNDFGIGVVVDA